MLLYKAGGSCCRLLSAGEPGTGGLKESSWGRARIRAQRSSECAWEARPNLLEAFPTRPKHMQRRTYARLRELDIRLLNRSTADSPRSRASSGTRTSHSRAWRGNKIMGDCSRPLGIA